MKALSVYKSRKILSTCGEHMGNRNSKRREKMGQKIFDIMMAEISPDLMENIYRYQKISEIAE